MLKQIEQYIEAHSLFPGGTSVLACVSGGVDSMVLLHMLHALGYDVHCAHVNYRMRETASDADQAFVEAYCRAQTIPCHVHVVDDDFLARAARHNFQHIARTARYQFFENVAVQNQIEYVAVGHHQDDQVETVLMHLMRGSGIEGLAGISPKRTMLAHAGVQLTRPLLSVSRQQIEQYAEENGISWREDRSNQSGKDLRNKLRHGLVNDIRASFGESAVANIARSADHLRGYLEASIEPALEEKFKAITDLDQSLNIELLLREHVVWQERIVLEALRRWIPLSAISAQHAKAIRELLHQQPGRRFVLGRSVIWRDRAVLKFQESGTVEEFAEDDAVHLVLPEECISWPGGSLEVSEKQIEDIDTKTVQAHEYLADVGKLSYPLRLRRSRAGDRFAPFGMQGQKKLSDFLTDVKVPPHEKARVYVLLSGDQIVWVVGYRSSEATRIDQNTKKVLYCKFVKND